MTVATGQQVRIRAGAYAAVTTEVGGGLRALTHDGRPLDAATGLTWSVAVANLGDDSAPVGLGVHPYVVAPSGGVDDWTLTFDAARIQLATADRLMPTGIADLPDADSFRRGRRLAGVTFDGAVSGLTLSEDGLRRASLTDDNGDGVEFRWGAIGNWLQLFTCDDLPGELQRAAVAIEPQTCPPDAFNNGIDLAWVAPGESLELTVGIGALTGRATGARSGRARGTAASSS
ncbi:MAG: hypothetical protein V9G19_03490 [Tetrasphaera sp.]